MLAVMFIFQLWFSCGPAVYPVVCLVLLVSDPGSGERWRSGSGGVCDQRLADSGLWTPGSWACQDPWGRAGSFLILRHRLPSELPPCDWQLQCGRVSPAGIQAFHWTRTEILLKRWLMICFSVFSSGLLNFCAVALMLWELGYRPVGVRLDSGDLCRQSMEVRRVFRLCGEQWVRRHAARFLSLTPLTRGAYCEGDELAFLAKQFASFN